MNQQVIEQANIGAQFSECRNYRYALWRIWDIERPLVMFIGLNPSTANETDNDPTIKSVCRIAKNNGYGGVYMMNCFPLVSTNPEYLTEFYEGTVHEVEDIENMRWLLEVGKKCKDVVFAWGNFREAEQRGKSLVKYFKEAKVIAINKSGSPKHPLYCKSETRLIPYNQTRDTTKEQDKMDEQPVELHDEIEFISCSRCDGHPACEDYGCAFELGLGKMVRKNIEPGNDDWS